MAQFVHPAKKDITLQGVLSALADQMRLRIVARLMSHDGCLSCANAAPCPNMAKSTLSYHFRILREAGLVRTEKKGVEHHNILRREEIEQRFPGLLDTVMQLAVQEDKKCDRLVAANSK